MSTIGDWDAAIVQALNRHAGESRAFDLLMIDVAGSSLLEGGLFMAYFWWLWFRPGDGVAERRRTVASAFIGAVLAVTLARLLQVSLPVHQRPLHTAELGFVLPHGLSTDTLSHWSSFPSDHAVLFFALAVAIWRHSPWLAAIAAAWTLIVISLPRVYLGYHWPSDVIGGAVIGVPVMLLAEAAMLRTRLPDRIVQVASARPALFYSVTFLATYQLAVLFLDVRSLAIDVVRLLKA